MARGTLHTPKGSGRRRRNAPTHGETRVRDTGEVFGPDLSDLTGREWSDRVVKWYETWRRVPWAGSFESTDWQRLGMLASVVDALDKRPTAALLAELRMNEERLGATFVDRMRARIVVESGETEEEAVPARARESYRALLEA